MPRALIGLGANLGARADLIERAMSALGESAGVRVECASRLFETRPVGGPPDQPRYLNAAATLDVALAPLDLWRTMAAIETRLGRERTTRWGARTIDLDLLLYDEVVTETPELTLPHPRLATRRFVLEPAAEIAAELRHPAFGWTIGRLYEHLLHAPPMLVVAGSAGGLRSGLAERLRGESFASGAWSFVESELDGAADELLTAAKLIVLVDEATAIGATRRQRLAARRNGPYLIVDGADESRARDDVAAALAGMA